jgi:hypothetical protein
MAFVVASQLPRRPHAFRIADAIEVFAFRALGTPGNTSKTTLAPTLYTLDAGNTGPAVLPAIRIRTAFTLVAVHAVAVTLVTAFFQVAFAIRGASFPTVACFLIADIALWTVLIPTATAFELPVVIGAGRNNRSRKNHQNQDNPVHLPNSASSRSVAVRADSYPSVSQRLNCIGLTYTVNRV